MFIFSVVDNIILLLCLLYIKVDKEWFDYIIGMFGIIECFGYKLLQMFGGQQQCVVVVCVLVICFDVIVVDELIGVFDLEVSGDLFIFLCYCVDDFGQIVVMVIYDYDVVVRVDDIVIVIDGQVLIVCSQEVLV